jgi:hypothetical protein
MKDLSNFFSLNKTTLKNMPNGTYLAYRTWEGKIVYGTLTHENDMLLFDTFYEKCWKICSFEDYRVASDKEIFLYILEN